MASISLSVQGPSVLSSEWTDLARRVEDAGFDTLYVSDHPGSGSSPFVGLAAAAAATERIRLGTCVANAGLWEPLALATQVATLDRLSGGRAVLGLGAGHTAQEWRMLGRDMPSAVERVDRLIEVVDATRALLDGDQVTVRSRHVRLDGATLGGSNPIQANVPLLIGGNGRRVLGFASRVADIVGVTGLGSTLADGHTHRVEWNHEALTALFHRVRVDSDATDRKPSVEALVQHVELTDDIEASAHSLSEVVPGASAADLVRCPFLWIGSPHEIARRLCEFRDRWAITRYVVRHDRIREATRVMKALALLDDTT